MKDRGKADHNQMRPIINKFAKLMETKLALNDHKPHWREEGLSSIFAHFNREVKELNDELFRSKIIPNNVLLEALDVALMAMMIADISYDLERI